jgi:hypothetical protein
MQVSGPAWALEAAPFLILAQAPMIIAIVVAYIVPSHRLARYSKWMFYVSGILAIIISMVGVLLL